MSKKSTIVGLAVIAFMATIFISLIGTAYFAVKCPYSSSQVYEYREQMKDLVETHEKISRAELEARLDTNIGYSSTCYEDIYSTYDLEYIESFEQDQVYWYIYTGGNQK